jgi:hypothetical protein
VEDVDDETGEITSRQLVTTELRPRLNKGGSPIFCHDPIKGRKDEQDAIRSFIGYLPSLAHGVQLDRARLYAHQLLRRQERKDVGIVLNTELSHRSPTANSARWSAAGYVAGIPHHMGKLIQDLEARERIARDDIMIFDALISYVGSESVDADTGEVIVTGTNLPAFRRVLTNEFPSLVSKMPILLEDPEGNQKKAGSTVVTTVHPIAAEILSSASRKDLRAKLASFRALAESRYDAIQADLQNVGTIPTFEAIERAQAAIAGRGSPIIEEAIVLQGQVAF